MTTTQADLLAQVCDLQAEYPDFHLWIRNDSPFEFDIFKPQTYHLIPTDIPGYPQFKKWLDDLAAPLIQLAKKNRRGKLTRNECFRYIKFAKKWLGLAVPDRLASYTLAKLRDLVDDLYKGELPTLTTEVTYKGVLSILRGLRMQGHQVTLRATLPKLLAQVKQLLPDWETRYHALESVVNTYDKVVHQALETLQRAFK